MSRGSVRSFLLTAKRHLQQAIRNKGNATFVIGNESADLDSITCAILYGYVQSSTLQARKANRLVIPVTNIPTADLPLRPELTVLLNHAGVTPPDLITLDDLGDNPLAREKTEWTLVDHNVLQGSLGKHYAQAIEGVIDHHEDEQKVPKDAKPRIIAKSGSCNSLVVNHCRDAWDGISSASTSVGAANAQEHRIVDDAAYTLTWDAQLAKLALGSILIDTVNMSDESKVTEHDRRAVEYLEARINASPKLGKDYDREPFYDEINAAKTNLDGLSVDDILRKDYKQWSEGDLTLGMSTVVKPIEYIQTKVEDLARACTTFAQKRHLHIFGVMTAYTDDKSDFHRQLLLIAVTDGKAVEAVQRFIHNTTTELKLQPKDEQLESIRDGKMDAPWVRAWDQENLAASRKQVAPLLREAMR